MFSYRGPAKGMITAGRVNALATGSTRRRRTFPDAPTFAELGRPELALDERLKTVRDRINPRQIQADARSSRGMMFRRALCVRPNHLEPLDRTHGLASLKRNSIGVRPLTQIR